MTSKKELCLWFLASAVLVFFYQLYLEVLPEDKSQWINKTKELRSHYEKIKETVSWPVLQADSLHSGIQ